MAEAMAMCVLAASPCPTLRLVSCRASPIQVRPAIALRSKVGSVEVQKKTRKGIRAFAENVDIEKIVPQADRVLVQLEDLAEKTEGGVLLPKAAVKFERYLVGKVLAAGKEAQEISKGQKVVLSDLNATEVNLGTKEKLCFCRAGDLLAVVE